MKTRNSILLSTAALFLAGSSAMAATVLIDFGAPTQTTTGNWNNASGAPGDNPAAISNMIDSTGASSGIGFAYSETSSGGSGFAGTGANYAGSYPTSVNGLPTSALQDGLFMNDSAHSVTLTFSGLDSDLTYSFLAYGARGNNGSSATYTVTGGNSGAGTISNVFNNSTETVNITGITPNGSDEITFLWTTNSTGSGSALNLIQITTTAIPEPSSLALTGLAGLALMLRRRR